MKVHLPKQATKPGFPAMLGLALPMRRGGLLKFSCPTTRQSRASLISAGNSKRPTALIAMHSFTPHHKVLSAARPWPIAILFNRDARIANGLIDALRNEAGLNVGVNEPYKVDDESDYAVPIHGEQRGLPVVEIEIRQDLIASSQEQQKWGGLLAPILQRVVDSVLAVT